MFQSAPRQVPRSTHRSVRRCIALAACTVLLLATFPPPAHAQIVRGRVIDAATGRAIDGASVALVDDGSQTLAGTSTDALGRFRIALDGAARTGLRVERAGYRGFIAEAVPFSPGEEIVLEVRMATDRIVIGPITVVGRRRIGDAQDYSGRLRLMRTAGIGRSLVRAEIAQREVLEISDLLATIPDIVLTGPPRARTVLFTSDVRDAVCRPRIFVNARPLTEPLDLIGTPLIIDALELYTGPVEAPAEFEDPAGCGVVLIWTRPDPADAGPTRWRRAVVYIFMTAIGLALFTR